MIMAPAHHLRYGSRNRMPIFRDLEGPTAGLQRLEIEQTRDSLLQKLGDNPTDAKKKEIDEATKAAQLNDLDRELIIRWLLKDYRAVFGGEPIAP